MDTLFLIAFFFVVFLATFLFSAAINWLLKRYFGVSIYPKDFFKSEKDTWSKW